MSVGGRMEFAMPKARVIVEGERQGFGPEVHVWWACFALAVFLGALALGQYIERGKPPPPNCRSLLPDGRALLTEHLGPRGPIACTYTAPIPTKRKWT